MAEHAEQTRSEKVIEMIELGVLAIVAIATAWSGFQATQWGGEQSRLYGLASTTRFEADAAATLGGQQLVADSSMFTAWLEARAAGDEHLEEMLVRRFSPDYATAFEQWTETDPFDDPAAPAGPAYMPGFSNPNLDQAKKLNDQASVIFGDGTEARETANEYARGTVLFATVLFFVVIAQRFRLHGVRAGANALALALLAYTLYSVADLPRL